MKYGIFLLSILIALSCSNSNKSKLKEPIVSLYSKEYITELLDSVWTTEQTPIRLRDSIGSVYGYESKEFQEYQEEYEINHDINEKKVLSLLNNHGWPGKSDIDGQGNLIICNVLQHSSIAVRTKYLPMMKKAVEEKGLQPRLLARAEDRLATDHGELQIYGGQIKYYPKTKSFDVWPIKDPENVDKRRAELSLVPMEEFLSNLRNPLQWNLEDQIKRSKQFEAELRQKNK